MGDGTLGMYDPDGMAELAEWHDQGRLYDDTEKIRQQMQDAYNDAKRAATGSKIRCPVCDRVVIKTTYHKVFCSNGRKKGAGNCKDRYWNFVPESRRKRANYMIKRRK